jgi:hypothetical protein
MATTQTPTGLAVAKQLVAAARADTVYADLYRQRARARMATVLSPADYERLKKTEPEIARAMKDSAAAVEQGDWKRVQALAGEATQRRQEHDARSGEMEFAADLYEHPQPTVDPFSPGLERLVKGAGDPAAALEQLRGDLEKLQKADPEWAAFYADRRAYFGKLKVGPRDAGETTTDPAEARREAMLALEQGQMARLQELAASMSKQAVAAKEKGANPVEQSAEHAVNLAVPFDAGVVEKAKGLGLEAVTLTEVPNGAAIIRRHALAAVFSGEQVTREGATRAQAVSEDPDLAHYDKAVREVISLFAINPYINSGGARYLPRLVAETLLVEGFPETEDPPADSPLLKALRLRRRKAVSRLEIEMAFDECGLAVLEEQLGLDPRVYKLVCIPCDVYAVLGRDRGWGQLQLWTHFDGYQLLRSGQLRALIGGDVRYGGRVDLVSIARDDERDKVVTRFAVVRRDRMVPRWL